MHPVVADIEQARQDWQLAGNLALLAIITDMVMPRPLPRRRHWWQIWRQR